MDTLTAGLRATIPPRVAIGLDDDLYKFIVEYTPEYDVPRYPIERYGSPISFDLHGQTYSIVPEASIIYLWAWSEEEAVEAFHSAIGEFAPLFRLRAVEVPRDFPDCMFEDLSR